MRDLCSRLFLNEIGVAECGLRSILWTSRDDIYTVVLIGTSWYKCENDRAVA